VPVRRARDLVLIRPPLESLYSTFDHVDSAADPVHIVRRYRSREDREVVGFCAAALAFGRVASVLRSIESLLAVMGSAPAAFVRGFDPARDAAPLRPLVHRWIQGSDLVALMLILQRMLRESGSIEAFFLEGDDPSTPDVGPALDSFSRRALETANAAQRPSSVAQRPSNVAQRFSAAKRPGVCYFFPRPSSGSACKRLNLFLRWMVRKDAIDLGVWTRLAPARLIVPLDTHVIRVGRCLRLTRRMSPGWKMAAEITAALRALDPSDPVRYDFSLCHLGMMKACGYGTPQRDRQCPLRGVCTPEIRRQRSEVRRQKSEVRRRKAEVRRQK
jgi:uncharacterized protein (TIGR02757 family)